MILQHNGTEEGADGGYWVDRTGIAFSLARRQPKPRAAPADA